MKIIELDEKCKSCGGTGLYIGYAERDGAAVVCNRCNGTGCFHYKHEYEEFAKRQEREDIKWVVEVNPGICIGLGNGKYKFQDFGGMSYKEWKNCGAFQPASENRNFTCPAWWYQTTDSKKKPEWDECISCGFFSGCSYFPTKDKCWQRWDMEYGKEN